MSQITSKKISIVIIHYNTAHYLKSCFDGILKQSYKNIEIIFIDNNSPNKDGLKYVQKEFTENPRIKIVPNDDNLGYAKAANQGIRMAIEGEEKSDYVVITNPDIIYSPTYFEKIIHRIEKDSKIAAVTGKVYKYDFDRNKPTNIIDTVGLFAYKNRRIIDDGQGLIDDGQFEKECEVFGVSGACPIYRREALEDIKVMGEYLDEDFFMYKEDVDISWRFLLYGWKSIFYPKAIAFHGRGTGIYRRFFNREVFKNRNKLSKFQKHYSFKNQNLMQLKNELPLSFIIHFPAIFFRKLAGFAYISVFEPYLWKSYLAYLKQAPRILQKRKLIMDKRRISTKEINRWFKKQSKYLKKPKL